MSRRSRRILAILLLAGLAPGLWWRAPLPPLRHDAPVAVRALATPVDKLGPMKVAGAWELASANEHFGGYSALAVLDDGSLLAASDRGRRMQISLPLGNRIPASALGYFGPGAAHSKHLSDLEALARDPVAGTLWAAYENLNRIERVAIDGTRKVVTPPAMAQWPTRSGAEAMARLPDGRFLIIAEDRSAGRGSPALLYSDDPLGNGEAISFRFAGLPGYNPTGAAALPDGRVLILLRAWKLAVPPQFVGAIVVANPAEIQPGESWRSKLLAKLAPPLPTDNYEGIAVLCEPDGSIAIWLISDDNRMRSQRSLLLKLTWDLKQKAREAKRAP